MGTFEFFNRKCSRQWLSLASIFFLYVTSFQSISCGILEEIHRKVILRFLLFSRVPVSFELIRLCPDFLVFFPTHTYSLNVPFPTTAILVFSPSVSLKTQKNRQPFRREKRPPEPSVGETGRLSSAFLRLGAGVDRDGAHRCQLYGGRAVNRN